MSSNELNNNHMKKILMLSILCAFAASSSLVAQHDQEASFDPDKKAKQLTEKMAENLQLNEEQKEKAYQANLEHLEQMKEMHKKHKEMRDQMRNEMTSLKNSHDEKMKNILTDEQYKTHVENRKGMMEDRKEKGMKRRQMRRE